MISFFRTALIGLAVVAASVAQEGHYEGVIQAPDREVKFTVDLGKGAKQEWIGYLSMVQGPREIPLTKIDVKAEAITFTINAPQAPVFNGKWDKEAKTIKGEAAAPNGSVPFELTRTGDFKAPVTPPSTPITAELVGTWEGTLEVGGRTLRLQVDLKQGAEGRAEGKMVSLDQGNQEIPITTITQSGNKLEFEVRLANGKYVGTLNEAKTEIAGEWTQGPRTLPLTLKKAAK